MAVATTLNSLALLYRYLGQFGKAEPLFQRSLAIHQSKLGPEHPDLAASLHNLALVRLDMGKYGEAEPLFQRSIKIKEISLGPDHPEVSRSLGLLAEVYAALERWDDAEKCADRARRISREHVLRILPALSDQEQLTFLRVSDQRHFCSALSLGLARRHVSEVVNRSASWVLNGKGVAHQVLAEAVLSMRNSRDPQVAKMIEQLGVVRRRLATTSLRTVEPGRVQERRQQVEQLSAQEQALAKQLARDGGRIAGSDSWVDLEKVQKVLPYDAVLIEIVRFWVANVQHEPSNPYWGSPHYAAWIIPSAGRGNVRLVDFGEAAKKCPQVSTEPI
jgi:tetratricopeptide (TPR) repeat protein